MKIWILDAHQRQKDRTLAELCYFVSLKAKISRQLVIIMLLSPNKVTMIFTVKRHC